MPKWLLERVNSDRGKISRRHIRCNNTPRIVFIAISSSLSSACSYSSGMLRYWSSGQLPRTPWFPVISFWYSESFHYQADRASCEVIDEYVRSNYPLRKRISPHCFYLADGYHDSACINQTVIWNRRSVRSARYSKLQQVRYGQLFLEAVTRSLLSPSRLNSGNFWQYGERKQTFT